MENYLFIDKSVDKIEYGEVKNKELVSYCSSCYNEIRVGDIFRSVVKKKVPSLNCYFVELEGKKEGFLDFKDVIYDIKLGDVIFVEVYKINLGNKAPNVSMNFSVSSMFSVISYKNTGISLSKKIKNSMIKLEKFKEIKTDFGIKLRTKCIDIDEEFVLSDVLNNLKIFEKIIESRNNLPHCKLIYRNENFLTDFLVNNNSKICVVNDKKLFKSLKNDRFLENEFILDENYKLKYDYNVGIYMESLTKKSLSFKNINIVIENFEALTVVDVNSKNSFLKNDKSKNSLKINEIALKEIVRQISFRNISGIIIVDFINMKLSDRESFESLIKNLELPDERIWTFHGFTKTGLYEITRQRGK
ncbi:MAG: ribonuclease E/G [Peptoniphilaceae bacterium]|uniref:ribonuclease E/G n=1 Tax=Parvimonas sp. TaxID=1944660 RepID=UPI002A75D7C5|nr:ribonuclease E/G [Parvimonas sp.]MDD7765085.1 ribonuclease E/G [Peptoniphilaceae bacterium]MDY3050231.1 ribonuclease E/G [Parvimonas sp.]